MIALTICTVALLVVLAGQALTASYFARRNAARRLRTDGLSLPADHAEVVISRIARRTRVNAAGGAAAIVAVTSALWVADPTPEGAPDLSRIALVLSGLALGGAAAEALHVLRTTPPPPPGVRVAGLAAREPHLTEREARAEKVLIGTAVLLLPVAAVAWLTGLEESGAAPICIAAAVAAMLTTGLTRRWLLERPAPANDADEAVGSELTTGLSVDRATEGLISYGSLLMFYAAIATGTSPFGIFLLVMVFTVVIWATVTAQLERSRARKAARA